MSDKYAALEKGCKYEIPSLPKKVSAEDIRETLNVPMFEDEAQAAANGFNQCLLECGPIEEAAKRMSLGIDECLKEIDAMQENIDYKHKKIATLNERAEKSEKRILELLAERDADKARIAELTAERDALREGEMGDGKHSNTRAAADIYFQLVEECEIPPGGSLVEHIDDMRERLAELEARTLTVKLPSLKQTESGERYVWSDGVYNYQQDVIAVLNAAGISLKIEGE